MSYRADIRDYLIRIAHRHEKIQYKPLGKRFHLNWRSRSLSQVLRDISAFEYRQGRPMLTAIVVRATGKEKGFPGRGFTELAERLGKKGRSVDSKAFAAAEQNEVYAYWLTHAS